MNNLKEKIEQLEKRESSRYYNRFMITAIFFSALGMTIIRDNPYYLFLLCLWWLCAE